MKRSVVSGHFIASAKGQIFVLLRRPEGAARGCVLVVPPFAEEMNKCRRMVTETTIRLAAAGFSSVVPDLYGTGDSPGEFADSDCQVWLSDILHCIRWAQQVERPISDVLAVRLGCGFVVQLAVDGLLPPLRHSVLWQPVFDGGRFLRQFLRMRLAAGLMDDRKESLVELHERLGRNEIVEVGGYGLSARLAAGLAGMSQPSRLPANLGEITWVEVVRTPDAELPAPTTRLIADSCGEGSAVDLVKCTGEPFWASTEIIVNRDAVDASVWALTAVRPGPAT